MPIVATIACSTRATNSGYHCMQYTCYQQWVPIPMNTLHAVYTTARVGVVWSEHACLRCGDHTLDNITDRTGLDLGKRVTDVDDPRKVWGRRQ